ncbi:MAG: hypothetical protein HZC18_07705 [Candidatus Omnitrophica bacterium]|nr:hypothetical protein [Candidatus Omnitrophota bacterium]
MPLMNSATGFRAHRMLEVVVKGITLYLNSKQPVWILKFLYHFRSMTNNRRFEMLSLKINAKMFDDDENMVV